MRRGKEAQWDFLIRLMDDPRALLEVMDQAGVWRVGLVNYPSPDVIGFTDTTNSFAARYAQVDPERLLPYGGVHPRFTKDAAGDVDRLVDPGVPLLKIHPPHPGLPPKPHTDRPQPPGPVYRPLAGAGPPPLRHTPKRHLPPARA